MRCCLTSIVRPLLTLGLLLALPAAWAAEAPGPVTIGGVTYESVDPGEPFKEQARPAQDWQAPAPSPAEEEAGLIPFTTPDPGDLRSYRVPRPEERAARLSAFLAQGEDEPVWFGIYALSELRDVRVTVSQVAAQTGPNPVTVDVRHMHCWPQRTGWRSREWYLTPEMLLPCSDGKRTVPAARGVLREEPFNVPAGATAGIWLTLSAREQAQGGSYRAVVTVRSAGHDALVLPLEIEVLPFKLERPKDRWWLVYSDARRHWGAMSDAQILGDLRDFARHGMTGLISVSLGTPDLSHLKEGKVTWDAAPYLRVARLCREAGIPGPHVVLASGSLPAQVRDALGIQCDVTKDPWPAALREGVSAVARAAVEATRDDPATWYYYGVDEPSGTNTYAIQDYQAWHAGGAATYATFYQIGFLEKASEFLTAPCFVSGLISNPDKAWEARETCARTGAQFWWYGTGCYVNPYPQEGRMFANRYGAGCLFRKSGAVAEATWTFCRANGDIFNDFDGERNNRREPKEQATVYPHLLKPDDWSTYQGAIPTIAWESVREGIDDYSYFAMLDALAAEAKKSPDAKTREAAEAAEAKLAGLLDAMPWLNPMGKTSFETTRLHEARRAAVDGILDLRKRLGK